ncbi:MAG: adenylyltransferase/cytidyltransferase family protein [Planctomycetes bacterium]|nr:adenylyltransferase/cytidyltransferase family protein [Planctomycetota bacterium]
MTTETTRLKIVSLERLYAEVTSLRAQGKRIVLAHGCFDLLHIGHIRYLESARQMGDALVVTLSPDEYVDKGPERPAFNSQLRAEALASLHSVDWVAVNDQPTAVELLSTLRPAIYVKGSDFAAKLNDPTGKLQEEAEICDKLGIELRFTEDIVFSSSNLINRFFSSYPEELQEYISLFRSRHSLPEIIEVLDAMTKLTVCVAGDAILDEYCYCSTLGLSSKSPTIAMLRMNTDLYAGGVMAIANHLAGFALEVHIFTVLGENESEEEFISSALLPNVRPHYSYLPAAPTTKKTRFVEGYSATKLLEIYHMKDACLPVERDALFREQILKLGNGGADLILAADFGHGALSMSTREALCASDVFLAVNTQSNAGNKMMHTISRYTRADYASVTEGELRLDRRDTASHMRVLLPEAAHRF